MRFRIIRAALQRLTKSILGFAVSSLAHQKNTIIVVALGKIRVDSDSCPVLGLSPVGTASARIKGDQVRVSLGELGVLLHSFLMFGDGAIHLPGVLQIHSL